MKKMTAFFFAVFLAFLVVVPPQVQGGEVKIQVASTHAPTREFQTFAAEFLQAFGKFCEDSPLLPAQFSEEERIFYLIERRDQKNCWRIGICKPMANEKVLLGFASRELSFEPIWVVKWKEIKNAKQRRIKARSAAKFLFDYLQRKEV